MYHNLNRYCVCYSGFTVLFQLSVVFMIVVNVDPDCISAKILVKRELLR
jgi:hypothetical protein